MKIAVAQTRPVKGDLARNLESHVRFVKKALAEKAGLLVFPELSLTGYEPALARELRTDPADGRLDVLQALSDRHGIVIGAGLPTGQGSETLISLLIFRPGAARLVYSKQHLFPPEREVFSAGHNPLVLNLDAETIVAPAICYELSHTEHHEQARRQGATVYLASVLHSAGGLAQGNEQLAAIAREYGMTVFMSNYVGWSGGYECAGNSAVWGEGGRRIASLDGEREGLLFYDTGTGQATVLQF